MIPAFPANSQWTWFQRISQEEVSRRCWLCFYLFYAVTLALLLGGVFITLSSDHPPFALVTTMIATGIVFFILTGLMYLCEANKFQPDEWTSFLLPVATACFQPSLKTQPLPLTLAFHVDSCRY
uniref:Uncharacterized protein n=1 Tax=Bos indicus x Bos taurus TaxID=30522 RepID=A0A4W2FQ87_BOBOX